MEFVMNGVTWHGFQQMPIAAKVGSLIVVVFFDGEPEIWNCESLDGVESLKRYYRADWGDRDIPYTVSVVQTHNNIGLPAKGRVFRG